MLGSGLGVYGPRAFGVSEDFGAVAIDVWALRVGFGFMAGREP